MCRSFIFLFTAGNVSQKRICHSCDAEKILFACTRSSFYFPLARRARWHIINPWNGTTLFFFIAVHRHTSRVSRRANLKENCTTKMDSIRPDKERKAARKEVDERTAGRRIRRICALVYFFYLFSRINEAIAHLVGRPLSSSSSRRE